MTNYDDDLKLEVNKGSIGLTETVGPIMVKRVAAATKSDGINFESWGEK